MINVDYEKLSDKYKNILVTGGNGFIGSSFILRILEHTKINIFNIDKLNFKEDKICFQSTLGYSENRYNFYCLDICEKSKLSKVFQDINPDIIFHFAAESHVDRSIDYPNLFIESNILGTFNLLEEALSHFNKLGPNRKKKFQISPHKYR